MASGLSPSSSSPSSSSSTSLLAAKEKTNHTRLSRLLIGVGRCALQDVFDAIHPPSTLNAVLCSGPVHSKLTSLKSRRLLYTKQWDILYPGLGGSVTSANFDVTLLFLLLRNICSLLPPATGWDRQPPTSDLSMQADLVRIKLCRNELYAHIIGLKLSDTDFETNWNDIKGALIRLGGTKYEAEIQQLRIESMDTECENASNVLLHSWEAGEEKIMDAMRRLEQKKDVKVEVIVKGLVKVLTIGGMVLPWAAGSAYFLHRYKDDPDKVIQLVQGAIIPAGVLTGAMVTAIIQGSFIIKIHVSSLEALEQLWKSYTEGEMEKRLEDIIVTDDLKSIASRDVDKIIISISISEDDYRKARDWFLEVGVNAPLSVSRGRNKGFEQLLALWHLGLGHLVQFPFGESAYTNVQLGDVMCSSREPSRAAMDSPHMMPTINAKRKLLTERLQYFKNEVNPEDIIDCLNCLTLEDKQVVQSDQKNSGAISALRILVDRLRRRNKGFEQFVVALRHQGLDHVAQLLDPYESVELSDADATIENDHEKFTIIGTAVDVEVNVQIKLGNERKVEFENAVAKLYESSSNEPSCTIRKEFKQKNMPKGIEFVRTKPNKLHSSKKTLKENQAEAKEEDTSEDSTESNESISTEDQEEDEINWDDSFKVVFRLTSAEVAKTFWEMYTNNELEAKLSSVLVERTLLRLEMLDSEGDLKLDLKIFENEYQKIVEFFEEKESEQDLEMTAGELLTRRGPDNEAADALDEMDIKIPEVLLESHKNKSHRLNLKLREYQKELSAPAIEGQNVIICAPTNSGKTFVAMEIARLHLEKYKNNDNEEDLAAASSNKSKRNPKIIFIVSTQNLVMQQRTRFEEYLTKYSISDISGSNSTEIPLDFLLKTHDVIILTAQILLNALQRSSVSISQITLLIFDECHHTNKDHNYNKIMQNYMALKWSADPNTRFPQIVGLTASLGVGRSNETEKAKNHILQICANMDAWCISTVREHLDELEKNVTGGVPKRRLEKVDQEPNVFEKVIVQVMGKIETAAQRLSPTSIVAPADRVSQQYRQWVEGLEKDAISKALRDLSTYAKHLRRYHIALVINDTVRIKDAMTYLAEYFEHLDKTKFQPSDKKLQDLYQKATQGIQSRIDKAKTENPKLERLKKLILEFHEEDKSKDKSGETKGILFTRTRDSTKGITGWIEETPEFKSILRPKVLVGAGDGEVGMTQGEQEAIIEEFKKGEVNILIATTVAEEGLDIGDCNFVIRYNMAGNEISSVQSRGRIRADEGNYVYVGDSRSKGVNRERLNQYRELLMTTAVDEVQKVPHETYMSKIKEIQQKDMRKFQMKNFLSSKKIKAKSVVEDVNFYCRRCNMKACRLNEFRRLKDNYHVILEKDFKHRIHVKPKKKSKKIDDVLMDSQVHCKECDEDWGVTVKIDGFTWPCLKIRSFAVELPDGKRTTFKKWSDFNYEIPEATSSEIIDQDDTLDNDDLVLDD